MQQQRTYWLVPVQGSAESHVAPEVDCGPMLVGQLVGPPIPLQPVQVYIAPPNMQALLEQVAPMLAQAWLQFVKPFWYVMQGPQNASH